MGKRQRTAARPSPPSPHSSRGTLGKACTVSWSSLPDEIVGEILGNLSLVELARITMTCSSFRPFYREKMAREQEARHQLAVNCFGSERIACLCALLVRVLKREPLSPTFIQGDWYKCWISPDGVLHQGCGSPNLASPEGNICVTVMLQAAKGQSRVEVRACNMGPYLFAITIGQDLKLAWIEVKHEEDHVPVALMQALLRGGLARSIRDANFHAEISVGSSSMQIGPLLPFASRYVPKRGCFQAYMVIGVAAE